MKKVLFATTALFMGTAAAYAGELAYVGGIEYAVEAEVFEATAGVEYGVHNFTFAPAITLNDAGGDFEFVSAEFTVGYDVNTNVNAYVTIESDADFDYAEATIGVAFRF